MLSPDGPLSAVPQISVIETFSPHFHLLFQEVSGTSLKNLKIINICVCIYNSIQKYSKNSNITILNNCFSFYVLKCNS